MVNIGTTLLASLCLVLLGATTVDTQAVLLFNVTTFSLNYGPQVFLFYFTNDMFERFYSCLCDPLTQQCIAYNAGNSLAVGGVQNKSFSQAELQPYTLSNKYYCQQFGLGHTISCVRLNTTYCPLTQGCSTYRLIGQDSNAVSCGLEPVGLVWERTQSFRQDYDASLLDSKACVAACVFSNVATTVAHTVIQTPSPLVPLYSEAFTIGLSSTTSNYSQSAGLSGSVEDVNNDDKKVIIGVVVAVLVLIVIAIVIGVILWRRRGKRMAERTFTVVPGSFNTVSNPNARGPEEPSQGGASQSNTDNGSATYAKVLGKKQRQQGTQQPQGEQQQKQQEQENSTTKNNASDGHIYCMDTNDEPDYHNQTHPEDAPPTPVYFNQEMSEIDLDDDVYYDPHAPHNQTPTVNTEKKDSSNSQTTECDMDVIDNVYSEPYDPPNNTKDSTGSDTNSSSTGGKLYTDIDAVEPYYISRNSPNAPKREFNQGNPDVDDPGYSFATDLDVHSDSGSDYSRLHDTHRNIKHAYNKLGKEDSTHDKSSVSSRGERASPEGSTADLVHTDSDAANPDQTKTQELSSDPEKSTSNEQTNTEDKLKGSHPTVSLSHEKVKNDDVIKPQNNEYFELESTNGEIYDCYA